MVSGSRSHRGVCRHVKAFGLPWLEEAADEVVQEFAQRFDPLDADLKAFPIHVSHLAEVGEGVQLGISPRDPHNLGIVADFESDIEVRRRRRLSRDWTELRSPEQVRAWLRQEAETYLARLRSMRGSEDAD